MEAFGRQHPGLTAAIIAIMLMLNARIDYAAGLGPIAHVSWFLGGVVGEVALFCWIVGYWLFLGILRLPLAVFVLMMATYALCRFRPKRRGPHPS